MVVDSIFEDIFDLSSRASSLILPVIKQQKLTLKFTDVCTNEGVVYQGSAPILPFAKSEVFNASIKKSRRLIETGNDCKAVYEVTFNISRSNFTFHPGDTIGIIPHNSCQDVDYILNVTDQKSKADLQVNIDVYKTSKTKLPAHIPVNSTLRHILTNCVDFRSVVKKVFLLELSRYTEDNRERKALEYLCSKDGAAMYTQHILNKKLGLFDILKIFKTCKPPIEVLLIHLPRLLPRPYSVANSMKRNENELKICFSVMVLDNKQKGLTTGWMEDVILSSDLEILIKKLSLNESKFQLNKIPIYLRKNMGFTLPQNPETPLLLIGPGTGVAPFIGFLEERLYLKEEDPDLKIGDTWLFYGCRHPNVDCIYKTEIEGFHRDGVLNKISRSYSRIENGGIKYVQDAIKHEASDVISFIEGGAVTYVCGDLNKMAAQVRQSLVKCYVTQRGLTERDAESTVSELEREGRYIVDVWS